MVIFGAVAAAIGWGISDYLGGDVSRREAPVFAIVGVSELLGVLLLVPVLIAREGDAGHPDDSCWRFWPVSRRPSSWG